MKKIVSVLLAASLMYSAHAQSTFEKVYYTTKATRLPVFDPLFFKAPDSSFVTAQTWTTKVNNTAVNALQVLKLDNSTGAIQQVKSLKWDINSPNQILPCADGNNVIMALDYATRFPILSLTKVSSSGHVFWSKLYNSQSPVINPKTVLLNGNSLIVACETSDPDSDKFYGRAGVLTVDYTTGNYVSYDTYAPGSDQPDSSQAITGIMATKDGGYLMYGTHYNRYPLFIKFNNNIQLQWAKVITMSNYVANIRSLVETNDEGFVFCGSKTTAFEDDGVHMAGKINSAGSLVWMKTYKSNTSISFNDLNRFFTTKILPDGTILFAGRIEDPGTPRSILMKVNAIGNVLWAKTDSLQSIFSSLETSGNTIAVANMTPAGGTFIKTFNTAGGSCGNTTNLQMTASNVVFSSINYPIVKQPLLNAITDSNVVISPFNLGGATNASLCPANAVADKVVKVPDFSASLVSNVINNSEVNVRIESKVYTKAEIFVKGMNNQLLSRQTINISKGTEVKKVNLPQLTPGVYLVQITGNNESHLMKFYKN